MTLKEKREIIVRFKAGESCVEVQGSIDTREVEQVIREYLLSGKTIPEWFRVPKRKVAK